MRMPLLFVGAALFTIHWVQNASADEALEAVQETAQLIEDEKLEAAIVQLEEAADHGLLHPELSFNRGIAYFRRAQTPLGRPSDLGQAAAGFAETLTQRPVDAEAERGLEEAQLAVARRDSRGGAKQGGASVGAPLGLLERALLALSPLWLFVAGAMGSLLVSTAIFLLRAKSEQLRLIATISLGLGLTLLLPSFALYQARSALFSHARQAVVIATEAPVLDETGRSVSGAPSVKESAVVYVGPAQRGLVPLVGFGSTTWLRAGQLRVTSHSAL